MRTPSRVENANLECSPQSGHANPAPKTLLAVFALATCFALGGGFVEALGLLAFQHLNWGSWARMIHVSAPILWISPVVNLCFFLFLAAVAAFIGRIFRASPVIALSALLTFLSVYDWLMVTGRLYRRASLLLALGVAVVVTRWVRKHEEEVKRTCSRAAPPLLVILVIAFVVVHFGTRWREERAIESLPQAVAGNPNIMLIVIDTLRADHLSSYGYPRPTSPNIDAVARHGVLFENAIAPSSWSLPSHASLVTGRPVHEHGWGNVRQVPWFGWGKNALNGLPTLGEELERHGYRTGAFSANRLYFTANVGLGRGFIHFEDYFDSVGDAFVRTQFGREFARLYMNRSERSAFTHAFRTLGLASWLDKDSEGSGDYGGAFGIRKRANEVNEETLQWIRGDSNHPFFAMLNYLDVHYAYGGPRYYPKPEWDHGTAIDEYDAGLKYEDDYIGRLLQELDKDGMLKNTIVVVTSDHGESLGDHGLSFHGAALYRELLRVPLIISWPGHVPEGARVNAPAGNSDIAATLLELIGPENSSFRGTSLTQLWRTPLPSDITTVVSELPQTNTIVTADRVMESKEPLATDGSMRSVFTPQWHLISHDKRGDQIYDWKSDPGELNNLIDTPVGRNQRDQIISQTAP